MQALGEISQRDPLANATLALLVAWRQTLPPSSRQTDEEQELRMNLERVYERWEQKTLAKGRREGKAEGKAEGKTEGKAEAVLAVLESRGLTVTATQRKQVLACTDDAQLDAWLRAGVTVRSTRELLATLAPRRSRAGSKAKASRT